MAKKHTVRIRNGFSDRNSLDPISKEMQFKDFSAGTRMALFNALKNIMSVQIETRSLNTDRITKIIVEDVFNEQYKKYSVDYDDVMDDIYEIFQTEDYHVLITIIEFLCNLVFETENQFLERYHNDYSLISYYTDTRKQMNDAFEDEYVGYRFVNENIVPITNDSEIETIEQASQTPYERVNESISKAIRYISETGNKDYKNSVKESITALEQLLNIVLNTSGLTLSNAVEQLSQKVEIDGDLKASIKSMYNFASNVNGVRHGNNKNNDNITFDEAKLVLLFCSSTVNYFCSLNSNKEE